MFLPALLSLLRPRMTVVCLPRCLILPPTPLLPQVVLLSPSTPFLHRMFLYLRHGPSVLIVYNSAGRVRVTVGKAIGVQALV